MQQARSLVIYWHGKGYTAQKMHAKLSARLDSKVPSYPTVTAWIRALNRGEDIQVRHRVAGLPADVWLDLQIFSQLEFFPFIHSLALTNSTEEN
jgi:hypothetical protein